MEKKKTKKAGFAGPRTPPVDSQKEEPAPSLGQTLQNLTLETPVWIRLPKVGSRDPMTGLCRSTLNFLVLPTRENNYRPPVRSRVLRQKGRVRGIRLIMVESLLAYIESQDDGSNKAA